jgi:hypothetical protein
VGLFILTIWPCPNERTTLYRKGLLLLLLLVVYTYSRQQAPVAGFQQREKGR